ncbi:helix-turn-helix domain-containing protein [uncultured Sulfitobacter sp.]|uniref:helix-turn-helix domain-containing protein n=1 Tax=uncultured Sulfitobacter sp. TaxID=191468 RepID=UPI002636ADCC|nr:helix-turn-helix domain-containing protein [uncultured Sulfitobacter sp.]
MPTKSQLILPPKTLSNCIAGCIVRDTRGVPLSVTDRVNYFPASPLYTVTLTFAGRIHMADQILPLEQLRKRPCAPKRLFMPPQSKPQMSWSSGPIWAMTVAFYPDAWQRLGGTLDGAPPETIEDALSLLETGLLEISWSEFWQEMSTIWAKSEGSDWPTNWSGSDRLKDWTNHLMGQLLQTGLGRSLRSTQRRLQRWTGLDKQALEFFARIEEVHRLISAEPTATPAELATEAGFADQSHMGRSLKRATGFSPVSLNQKIATEESFWCYRLLGERF